MNEIKINEMNYQLPNWDLSEIYKDIKDPNIAKDIKEIKALSDDFLTKWKGKIKTREKYQYEFYGEKKVKLVSGMIRCRSGKSIVPKR